MRELADFLKEKGHFCVDMSDHKFTWCMKDKCPSTLMYENMNKVFGGTSLFGQDKIPSRIYIYDLRVPIFEQIRCVHY